MAFLLTQLKDSYINIRGFHTERKLVVFESDDWGSIRMPSKSVYDKLEVEGDNPGDNPFLRNDSIESELDLRELCSVLESFRDSKGHHPIFTLNFAVANPNFDRIDFERGVYEYEPFFKTYDRYYGENEVLKCVKDGISNKLLYPQLHCREHLNVGRWMRDLKEKRNDVLLAFKYRTIGVGASFTPRNRFGYMDAFNTDCSTNEELEIILNEAINLFEDVFGYQSSTFVASCFVWNDYLESCLKKRGVKFIQSDPWQNYPMKRCKNSGYRRIVHYTGQKNKYNQLYSVRNCTFEPSYTQDIQFWVERCMKEVESSFKAKKPAIIGTHRVNYIGSIDWMNRVRNLIGLNDLLSIMVTKYPDIEFVSSSELFSIMERELR